ncbi:MAG TPA: hypothetical protein H9989_03505 [Candidatus Lawsonibacter pullicola]|nr:hypothetical protein [Candidatus Lawsonibacter pullicola]
MDENRHRHTVWMDDAVWDQVEAHYQADNCSTRNEFVEKAIRFYSGYLDTEHANEYLPRVLADVLEGKLGALGNRMGHLLFKLSVDQNLMGNILAADIDIAPDELRKARVRCVKEVKETNGEISFEDAVRYQKGAE